MTNSLEWNQQMIYLQLIYLVFLDTWGFAYTYVPILIYLFTGYWCSWYQYLFEVFNWLMDWRGIINPIILQLGILNKASTFITKFRDRSCAQFIWYASYGQKILTIIIRIRNKSCGLSRWDKKRFLLNNLVVSLYYFAF